VGRTILDICGGKRDELVQGRARYVHYADSIYQTRKLYEELDGGERYHSTRMGKRAGGKGVVNRIIESNLSYFSLGPRFFVMWVRTLLNIYVDQRADRWNV